MNITIDYFLILSAIMLGAGMYGFFTRRNTLAILISIELILNAADLEGYVFTLFSIAISAAETAIAIAVMINVYRMLKSNLVDELDNLKW